MRPDEITIAQVAFGARYKYKFTIQDNFGSIIDAILENERFSADRFPKIGQTHDVRQLLSENEKITISREDAILESREPELTVESIRNLAEQFNRSIWGSVWEEGGRPEVIRWGCLISFLIPPGWAPVQAMLSEQDSIYADFLLRYAHRLPAEEAKISKDTNDYHTVIYQAVCNSKIRLATIDFQHYFDPPLEDDKSLKFNSYEKFVERALSHFAGKGLDFLRSKFEIKKKAA